MMRVAGIAVAIVAVALVAGVGLFVSRTPGSVLNAADQAVRVPTPRDEGTVRVAVRDGDSPRDIGERLERAGVIQSSRLFRVVVALEGVGGTLIAGDYEFEKGLPVLEVVDRIHRGITAPIQVTIAEGLQSGEIADLLERKGVVQRGPFLAALEGGDFDFPFLHDLPAGATREGFLFPATYAFSKDTPAEDVVRRLLQGFQDNVYAQISLEGTGLDLMEAVTLASIVEREAAVASERPLIASVFLNRLRAGLPLQADPTVQYALAGDPASVRRYGYWKKDLTEADLDVDSPYNTYVHVGLPPGPIANPGLDSIRAVLKPLQTNFLFFVAKPDGTHAFAATLEEHQRNVDQYQGGSP